MVCDLLDQECKLFTLTASATEPSKQLLCTFKQRVKSVIKTSLGGELPQVKVHLNPKYFFRLNKSLHLFETHFAFLNLILTFLQAIKGMKSSHHLFHDRASKGMGLVLVLRHKLLCMHVYKDLLRCKSVSDVKPGLDPCPLLARSWNRWLDFVTFTAYEKVLGAL